MQRAYHVKVALELHLARCEYTKGQEKEEVHEIPILTQSST